MASIFCYGVLAGLLVSVSLYGCSVLIQLVRHAPDGID